jgi:hypothetical protein
MGRRRDVRPSTPYRYMLKMYRLFNGQAPDWLIMQLVTAMNTERERNYAPYYHAWLALQNEPWFRQQPRGNRGLIKAALNYAIKAREKGLAREYVVDYITSVLGLNRDIAERIVNFARLPTTQKRGTIEQPKSAP